MACMQHSLDMDTSLHSFKAMAVLFIIVLHWIAQSSGPIPAVFSYV